MIRNRSHIAALPTTTVDRHRHGATLIEVLMSLLIFSVGIVSVFALFPISILQSIRATQLTNTRIQFDNVQELVKARPELLLGARYWEPGKNYTPTDVIVPRPLGNNRFPSNNFYYQASAGTSGLTEPVWGPNSVTGTGSTPITWTRLFSYQNKYVIDPVGRLNATSFPDRFGNGSVANVGVPRLNMELDLNIPVIQQQSFREMFSLPDSWNVSIEAVPTTSSASAIDLALDVDLSGVTTNDRVVITSANGRKSVIRNLTGYTGTTLNLATPLPNDFVPESKISTVRVEVYNRRYTWMLTVNREATGGTQAQCAVFFNRGFNFDDEHVYQYNVDPLAKTVRNEVRVFWDPTVSPEPLIREGNFVFDTISCEWYRMVSLSPADPPPPPGSSGFNILLEKDFSGTHTFGDPTDNSIPEFGGLIFMPGIVHVYDL